jgi:hypothetical protein
MNRQGKFFGDPAMLAPALFDIRTYYREAGF